MFNSSKSDMAIEEKAVALLKKKKLLITTAESCTGGLVGASIVNVGGASAVFHEGYITYSNEAKIKLLNVSPLTLERFTAVSKETACEMAIGGAKNASADVCVAVTGVAGPSMEDGKPVGLVYISCFYKGNVKVYEYNFFGDRQQIRQKAVDEALKL
ncbi:MAG: CinA family protein, partial [Eubacteriales bacterium]|nr:CinA family protein [Eubacteriales bacterium]